MKRMMRYLFCLIASTLCWGTLLQAKTTEVVLSNSMKCTKEELARLFPEQIVQDVLKKADLPQKQVDAITETLVKKDLELDRIVQEKVAQADTDRFKNLGKRAVATKIYQETLYEVFAQVLKQESGITDKDKILSLLNELQEARSKLFIECIRKQPRHSDPKSTEF